jgi:predicted KAP-like P-loop ATPase
MWVKVRLKRPYNKIDIPSFDEEDLFERKFFWESLMNLIEYSENESLVLSIDAPWWEWKTHFLFKWKSLLEEKWRKVIYFDSFKNDYIEDPFTALLWEVMKVFKWDITTYEKIKEKWTNVLKSIIPLAWKIWARIVLWWDIKWVEDKLEEIIEWEIVEWIGVSIKSYIRQEDVIESFKKTLQEAIKKDWKIIFIIDELDRCRPDFAFRLLERMKHFFDIPGLYFVLWINKNQLLSYISKIYWDIDKIKYLQKFIDIETTLPIIRQPDKNPSEKYVKLLIKENRDIFLEKDVWESHHILQVFKNIIKYWDFSLRDIEKAFN